MTSQLLTILGSTGSVGESTLDVVRLHPDRYTVYALTANRSVEKMLAQCLEFKPKYVAMVSERAAEQLMQNLRAHAVLNELGIEVLAGANGVAELAAHSEPQAVMSAIVGAAGLLPTLAAVKAGKRVLIANKEPLVMTGDLLMQEAAQHGATILPIDSEHNAIFQCLPSDQATTSVNKLHLTASGGPFRGRSWDSLADITPAQAIKHPNWSMGKKISVDSATLMNKGLELIEATALFAIPAVQVDILIHPQSIIHSLVEYCDGTFLAQLGAPDMRIPIAHALAWPSRHTSGAETLDLAAIAQLDFTPPDIDNLPCLRLAREAASAGGHLPTVLNAANEIAVAAFLQEQIRFTDIPRLIEYALEKTACEAENQLQYVLNIDNEARRLTRSKLDLLKVTDG